MNGKKVMRYNWNNSQFTYQEDMNHGHQYAACTVFNSPKHGNFNINKLFRFLFQNFFIFKKGYRPVLYVGSGWQSGNNAELLDYTVTNTWEQSNNLPSSHKQ